MKPGHILIIDDEPLLGQTLRFAFQDKHDVEVASSGREALDRLERAPVDLVVTDLRLTDLDGQEIVARCRELRGGRVALRDRRGARRRERAHEARELLAPARAVRLRREIAADA